MKTNKQRTRLAVRPPCVLHPLGSPPFRAGPRRMHFAAGSVVEASSGALPPPTASFLPLPPKTTTACRFERVLRRKNVRMLNQEVETGARGVLNEIVGEENKTVLIATSVHSRLGHMALDVGLLLAHPGWPP